MVSFFNYIRLWHANALSSEQYCMGLANPVRIYILIDVAVICFGLWWSIPHHVTFILLYVWILYVLIGLNMILIVVIIKTLIICITNILANFNSDVFYDLNKVILLLCSLIYKDTKRFVKKAKYMLCNVVIICLT